MTTVLVAPRPGLLGRGAAGLALGSAVVHVLLLDAGSLGSLVMVAMAAVCLPCAWHLWRSPSPSVWRLTALVDVLMLVLHAQMVGSSSGHGMAHGSSPDGGLMLLGLGLIVAQIALAAVALLRRRDNTADVLCRVAAGEPVATP